MTVQTLTLKGERYVLIREKDFRELSRKNATRATTRRKSPRRLTTQDRGDIAEAQRRLDDSSDRVVPYASARERLGLRA